MALEKITIATEEKQDKILQDISLVSSSVNQLAQKTVDTSNLADKKDIEKIKILIEYISANSLLQVKKSSVEETNCKYLLIAITINHSSSSFKSITAKEVSGEPIPRYKLSEYINTNYHITIGNSSFFVFKKCIVVTEFRMDYFESALMLKLE